MAVALRSVLRNVARKMQVRGYAAPAESAIKEGKMALTFAAGNKVSTFSNSLFIYNL